jgi:HD-GYP domain-containing protein (c-di-GMP phosphodiesterase class II)
MAKLPREKISGRLLVRNVTRLTRFDDVDEVLVNLARMLKRGVKSRWVVVYLLDREKMSFFPARSCGLPRERQELSRTMPFLPEKQVALRRLFTRRRHLLVPEPASSELFSPPFRNLLRPYALLAVPMMVRRQVTGVVLVARSRRHLPFTPAEISVVRDLVGQAALVTSHINLLDESLEMALEVAKRVDIILMLDDINKAISSSLSRERIVATAIERIEGVVQCDLQALIEVKEGELVVLVGRSDRVALPEQLLPGSILKGSGIIRRAALCGESQYLDDMGQSPRESALGKALVAAGVRSLLAVPLMGSEGARGVLLLGDRKPGRFRSEEAFAIEKIASQMAVALENARLYGDLRQLFFGTITSLANAIDAKSSWTKGHSERVMRVAAGIAREMGLSDEEVERVRLGGLMHDIGKIGIMEALLEKPRELDDDEFPPIRQHPEKGVAILEPIAQLHAVLPGILHHHEFFDGSGYPDGLSGTDIPLDARIIAVADSFDAMVADRPYRKGLSVPAAVEELVRCSGSQFDPEIVDCFRCKLAAISKDPSLAPDDCDARNGGSRKD